MEVTGLYDKDFYGEINDGAIASAQVIVPLVVDIFRPKSVIDFGCGTGAWLSEFVMWGVDEIYGLDGSDEGHGLIGDEEFELVDLAQPYEFDRKFDLAMSLEVAEHLPYESADTFVDNVCESSDNILWSAAVPGQRGVNHINEQWPSFWVPKFLERGFYCNGSFRYRFWDNRRVETWYKQNILLFSRHKHHWNDTVRDLIHPDNYHIYDDVAEEHKL